jgi:Holliday junction resolvasome RuvABC DNA-binding subunit
MRNVGFGKPNVSPENRTFEEPMTGEKKSVRASGQNYNDILTKFGAEHKPNRDSVRHLESLGYSLSQARNAVYQFRKGKGVVRSRAQVAPKSENLSS